MQHAIARQAEAERERRAKVINAEGEFQAAARLSDAADVISRNPVDDPAALPADADRGQRQPELDDRLPAADGRPAAVRPAARERAAELRRRRRSRRVSRGRSARRGRRSTPRRPRASCRTRERSARRSARRRPSRAPEVARSERAYGRDHASARPRTGHGRPRRRPRHVAVVRPPRGAQSGPTPSSPGCWTTAAACWTPRRCTAAPRSVLVAGARRQRRGAFVATKIWTRSASPRGGRSSTASSSGTAGASISSRSTTWSAGAAIWLDGGRARCRAHRAARRDALRAAAFGELAEVMRSGASRQSRSPTTPASARWRRRSSRSPRARPRRARDAALGSGGLGAGPPVGAGCARSAWRAGPRPCSSGRCRIRGSPSSSRPPATRPRGGQRARRRAPRVRAAGARAGRAVVAGAAEALSGLTRSR